MAQTKAKADDTPNMGEPVQISSPPTVFDQAVNFVLADRIEGGYVNDPRDPGGETKFGISKRSYPKVNIKALTRDDAIAIYKRDYWDAMRCDDLPPKIAVVMFDCAINQGAGAAPRLLQNALGNGIVVDGIIGPKTISAAHAAKEDDLVIQFIGWRLRRYAFTANSATYMRDWANRVLALQHFLLTQLQEA
ncbi:MAG: glycoside hydrolase family 108 protein [Paenirhodobacter sp.]|uniref:glycoside hydrolase family 108 protein n=1 Tax=Paenirhodobacter sp. TaxID=1965326 RepID=UPI003D12E9D2